MTGRPSSLPSTVILTGATGFVGGALLRALVGAGIVCHVIVRPSSDRTTLDGLGERVHVHVHDGRTESLHAICRAARADLAFHVAATGGGEHRPEDVTGLVTSNVLFATQFADALVAAGVRRLVNTGTWWQHYENRPYSPVCLYAATKQAFEAILPFYTEAHGLSATTLTLFDTYGPRDRRKKLFSLLDTAVASGEALRMTAGEQRLAPVYIDDMVRAYEMAALRLMDGLDTGLRTYAVRSETTIRLRDFVTLYERISGRRVPVVWGAKPYRPREAMEPWSDGVSLPGWSPEISLEEGIRRMTGEPQGAAG